MRIRSGWRTQERSLKPAEPHSLPHIPPPSKRSNTNLQMLQCCNPTQRPHPGWKMWRTLSSGREVLFPFDSSLGKSFLRSHLVQNTELISSGMQLRENGKSYLSTSSPLPNPMRRSLTLLILVLLEQWRLLKETFSLFLILVGFPQALVLIILFPSDLTTSHDSPFWWLSRMTSSSNLLHPAALWHNLGKSASHLCL